MPFLRRVCAAALVLCPIVLAVPVGATSGLDGLEQSTSAAPPNHDIAQGDGVARVASPLLNSGVSRTGEASPQRAYEQAELLSDPVMPVAVDGYAPLRSHERKASSEVPLPTGFSLFGAAILTLGLIGFVAGSPRRPALEPGGRADRGFPRVDKGPAAWFSIEVAGVQGRQVRHTGSARGAIDLIADLLNEGWDVVRISDREGLPVDYDAVIQAWRAERSGC